LPKYSCGKGIPTGCHYPTHQDQTQGYEMSEERREKQVFVIEVDATDAEAAEIARILFAVADKLCDDRHLYMTARRSNEDILAKALAALG